MTIDKDWCLNEAIQISKEYSRGGGEHPVAILEQAYIKLKELLADSRA